MGKLPPHADVADPIPALQPRGAGHQFLLYGDACSGVPDALHEKKFAEVNAVVRRLQPGPEFIIFPGDEIIGLTPDRDQLLAQWRHWIDNEMGWLDRRTIPMWHATGNHTTYDEMSEQVFREVLGLPLNGPVGQQGLSYWVRRGDLLLVFVNTLWSGLGGEGFVETQWLEDVLRSNSDAHHKLVVGHHPVFSVNGYSGPWQRDIEPVAGAAFWDILVRYGVRAYLCSHILAFDVQIHRDVLQICTAGAGTAHRMPEDVEYLHCVQVALDATGMRYQVLDTGASPGRHWTGASMAGIPRIGWSCRRVRASLPSRSRSSIGDLNWSSRERPPQSGRAAPRHCSVPAGSANCRRFGSACEGQNSA